MKDFKTTTFEDFKKILDAMPNEEPTDQFIKDELIAGCEDDKRLEYWGNPENLIGNIADECHDGAYTPDEAGDSSFTEDDLEHFLFRLRN